MKSEKMSNTQCTAKDIGMVLDGIIRRDEEELQNMSRADLEKNWFFQWDHSESLEWNTYKFHDLLKLYGGICRRWEEKHHGSACVVERVRDTYLMPKIREFVAKIKQIVNGAST